LKERNDNEQLTTTELLNHIVTLVHKGSIDQTPTIMGDGTITFFNVADSATLYATLTPKYPFREKQELDLHAGFAHGIMEKMVFAIYPGNKPDLTDPRRRLAYAEVVKVERITSTIKITGILDLGADCTGETCCAQFMFIAPDSHRSELHDKSRNQHDTTSCPRPNHHLSLFISMSCRQSPIRYYM
jgi:hypothetical protein